jgi:hypothetical protein
MEIRMQLRTATRDEHSGLKVFTLFALDNTNLFGADGSEKRYLVLNEIELAERFPAAREAFAQGLQTTTMEIDSDTLVVSPKLRSAKGEALFNQ